MQVEVSVTIQAKVEQVWKVITDIENAEKVIRGIQKIEILERPQAGLVGLKWRETRIMFKREAVETMWITAATENRSYQTKAMNHGAEYLSEFTLATEGEAVVLTMKFSSRAKTVTAKLLSALMGPLLAGGLKKTMLADLEDIKTSVENRVPA